MGIQDAGDGKIPSNKFYFSIVTNIRSKRERYHVAISLTFSGLLGHLTYLAHKTRLIIG
jgi:hypothetical protein